MNDSSFWNKLETILLNAELVIDRRKGSTHPKYPAFIYPFDYGYIKNTSAGDGNEIDVWRGSLKEISLDGIICTVDILKRDTEIKLLVGCTDDEQNSIVEFINRSEFMSAFLVKRNL